MGGHIQWKGLDGSTYWINILNADQIHIPVGVFILWCVFSLQFLFLCSLCSLKSINCRTKSSRTAPFYWYLSENCDGQFRFGCFGLHHTNRLPKLLHMKSCEFSNIWFSFRICLQTLLLTRKLQFYTSLGRFNFCQTLVTSAIKRNIWSATQSNVTCFSTFERAS